MTAPTKSDAATLDFYAREATAYTAESAAGITRHLHPFLATLAPNAKILELGCGGGHDSAEMHRLGFDVIPTDGVREIADQASGRIGLPVRVLRFDELDYTAEFDAVWASASLLHIPRASLPEILKLVHAALKPAGRHFATFKSGDREGRDAWGRFFNYPSEKQVIEAYRQSGEWQSIETEAYIGGGYQGTTSPWIAVTAVRSA